MRITRKLIAKIAIPLLAVTGLGVGVVEGAATNTSLPPGSQTNITNCSTSISLSAPKSPAVLKCTPNSTTTTTTAPTTTTTTNSGGGGGSAAFVQADDTGTFTGNTTSLSSGTSHQVLAHSTGIGHSVVLMIQTLTNPGTQTDTVTSVNSSIGTFQFVNSYNDGADYEIWVCLNTTGAGDAVTVNTPTNAWDAFAVEFNAPATGFINGDGAVNDPGYLANQSWTVNPAAAGNIAVIGVDTSDAYVTGPGSPWTYYNHGYWSFSNGTSAAWATAPSKSPMTATWETDGGESNSQGVVLEYSGGGGTTTTTTVAPTTTTTVPPTTTTTTGATGGSCTAPIFSSSNAEATINTDGGVENWWVNNDAWSGRPWSADDSMCASHSSWNAVSTSPTMAGR